MPVPPKMWVTVDVVLFTIKNEELHTLLVRRTEQPFKDKWVIPGGIVSLNQSLEEAALFKLKEKTGVKDIYLEQLYTFGDLKRDVRGRSITVSYFALIDWHRELKVASENVADAQWYSMDNLPPLGFDHEEILEYAHQRLKYKLEYTTVGFQLLSKKFTLTELQQVYEAILKRELDKRNFRKKIHSLGLLKQLKEYKREGAHRPAQLYTWKEKEKIFPRGVI